MDRRCPWQHFLTYSRDYAQLYTTDKVCLRQSDHRESPSLIRRGILNSQRVVDSVPERGSGNVLVHVQWGRGAFVFSRKCATGTGSDSYKSVLAQTIS